MTYAHQYSLTIYTNHPMALPEDGLEVVMGNSQISLPFPTIIEYQLTESSNEYDDEETPEEEEDPGTNRRTGARNG